MIGDRWLLLGEGKADVVFLKALLQDLDLRGIEVRRMGGDYTKLGSDAVQNLIRRASDQGRRVAAVLDADSSIKSARSEYERIVAESGLPIDRVFFVPNDADAGDLEYLLEKLVAEAHRSVLDCFKEYEDCLNVADPGYVTPNRKARIYAYCEAIGCEPKEDRRDYLNRSWWNLDASALAPLKRFLLTL